MGDEQELKLNLEIGVEDNASQKIKDFSGATKTAEKEIDELKKKSKDLKDNFGDLSKEAERLASKIGEAFNVKQIAQAKKLSDIRRVFNDTNKVNVKSGLKSGSEAKTVSELADAFKEMSAGQASSISAYSDLLLKIDKADKEAKKVKDTVSEQGKRVKKTASAWDKFNKSIGKIVLYRAVRRAMSDIGKAAQEGMENYYKYMMLTGNMSNIKNNLDSLSASGYTVSNSLGVTLSTSLATVEPLLTVMLNMVTDLNESLSTLVSILNTSFQVTKVNKEYMKQYAEQIKKTTGALQGFDEINNITLGKNGFDYSKAFETKTIGFEDIKDLANETALVTGLVTLIASWRKATKGVTSDMEDKNVALKSQSELTEKETLKVTDLSKAMNLLPIAGVTTLLGLLGKGLIDNKEHLENEETALGNVQTAYQNVTQAMRDYKTELSKTPAPSGVPGVSANLATSVAGIKSQTVAGYNTTPTKKTVNSATTVDLQDTSFNNSITNPVVNTALGIPSLGGLVQDAITDKVLSSGVGQTIVGKVVGVTEKVADFFKESLPSALRSFGEGALRGALSGFTGGLIPAFANGGFPQSGSLFLAGESGAELLGSIDGRTAVAGGNEITGIREAIYDVAGEIVSAIQNQEKLEINTRRLFKSMQSEAAIYTRSTGRAY